MLRRELNHGHCSELVFDEASQLSLLAINFHPSPYVNPPPTFCLSTTAVSFSRESAEKNEICLAISIKQSISI